MGAFMEYCKDKMDCKNMTGLISNKVLSKESFMAMYSLHLACTTFVECASCAGRTRGILWGFG